MTVWTELSGDDAIEAILAMIDEEMRTTAEMYRRAGFADTVTERYQEIRNKIDGGDWKDFAADAAIATVQEAGWQDIATAPKDALCLLFEPHSECGFCFVGLTNTDGTWVNNLDFVKQNPTHWMPLPPPPIALTAAALRSRGL